MKMLLHRSDLPVQHVFTIARGSTYRVRTVIVELQQDGCSGYGEAGESEYYGVDVDQLAAALEQVRDVVEATVLHEPPTFWRRLGRRLAGHTYAQCALDCAAWDLWAKLHGQPLWKLWKLDRHQAPPSDYTIGIDTIETMIAKLEERAGWPIYKVKLGTPDDLGIVRALRAKTSATLRVDANCAWNPSQALAYLPALAELGVELVEQPLSPQDNDAMPELFEKSPLPLVADESCRFEGDVDRCRGRFHGINIKLVKCGGLTPARRMIRRARQLGLKIMLGCMCESTVHISAAAQLAPLADYIDLDGPLLLAEDAATGVAIERDGLHYPVRPGCGIELLAK